MFRLRFGVLVLGVLAASGPAAAAADDVQLNLVLHGAVFQGDAPGDGDPALLLDVIRTDGSWQRVWGIARSFNVAHHVGRVVSGGVTGDEIELSIEILINGDAWVKGGRASYRVRAKRTEGNRVEGTFAGQFRGKAVSGAVEGTLSPPREKVVKDYKPLQPGEHPRILFRKSDLPALREKLKTPLGKAALAKMNDVVGLAVKYQLAGDKKIPAQLVPMIEKLMDQGLKTDQFGHNVGDRMQQVAIAYDCCYDVWPAQIKGKVETYLAWAARVIYFDQQQLSGGINWHVCSNWSAPVYTGAAYAGLVLWGEKGPAPVKPILPAAVTEIPPAKDYKPGKGVPVVPLVAGFCPDNWLMTTPLDFAVQGDPLATIGGMAQANVEAGTKFSMGGRQVTFAPLASDLVLPVGRGGINLSKLMADRSALTICLHVVYEVKDEGLFKVNLPYGRAGKPQMTLAGWQLQHEQIVKLSKGLYPATVGIALASKWESYAPTLDKATDEDVAAAKARLAADQAEYEQAMKDWQFDNAEWERLGGADVGYLKLFEMGRRMMLLHYREAVGTGGFQAEVGGYSLIATAAAAMYAPAYRTAFGEDCSPYGDISHYVPRKMFAHVYGPEGKLVAQDINGKPDVSAACFGILYPVVPDEWKPAVLWGWHRHAGVDGVDDPASAEKLLSSHAGHSHWNWIFSFLNYPLDVKPRPPQGILPLSWQAPDFGFYAFRNKWDDGDDFVAQVFLKAHFIGGWNGPNGGTFRLMGLGRVWAFGPDDRNRSRWEENVVQLPENPEINLGAAARATYFDARPDGSGVVSMDLADIYATAVRDRKGNHGRLYEAYGNIRVDKSFADSGIRGMRSVGVDYSGKCGAPCLFVVVDKIAGGKKKIWTWQVDTATAKRNKDEPGILDYTTVDGNTFTIAHPDGATLRGTLVAPEKAQITSGVRQTSMTGGAGSSAGKALPRPIYGVFAEGGDEFLCVVTVGRGDPPKVDVQGRGLGAKVRVGGQTVRFDGAKIIFGE